ncbi:MAG: hypothetical protein ACP5QA_16115 [Phycisphaerae bacterium]
MRHIDAIQSKPPVRRICADFHNEAAVEIDMMEVQIGIHRAARNKSERDAVLMEIALLSLRKHIEAFSAITGDKYPDYQAIAGWLESGQSQESDGKTACHPENRQNAISAPIVEQRHETGVHSE